jgi:NAD(P)-dependent dehydrogenase (short-subunit alcohol dehydrogenase family)
LKQDNSSLPVAVVTGAAGGMGLAVCRLLGRGHRLVVNDFDSQRLANALSVLSDEGYQAVGVSGDLAHPGTAEGLANLCQAEGVLAKLVNAAGLSPAMADWTAIIKANIIGPELLLRAFEPLLRSNTACVLIASIAGHLGTPDPQAVALLENPLQEELLSKLAVRLAAMVDTLGGTLSGHAYSLSKLAVIQTCERRAQAWGAKGARINSVSPGGVWTAMGRLESQSGARVNAVVKATPAGRWGTAMEIATAVEFLLSDNAGFVTGSDLRVDGGAVATLRGVAF